MTTRKQEGEMPQKYSKEDIIRFREDKNICDSKMIFWPDEQLVLVMERLGWKAGAASRSANNQGLLAIDRSKPFDPAGFSKRLSGCAIVGEHNDERSLALNAINPALICLETMLLKTGLHNEACITGRARLRRLKAAGYIRLDAGILEAFWSNQHLIPENWKDKRSGVGIYVNFPGTVLRRPNGDRSVLSLFRWGCMWNWFDHLIEGNWDDNYLSAVLTS